MSKRYFISFENIIKSIRVYFKAKLFILALRKRENRVKMSPYVQTFLPMLRVKITTYSTYLPYHLTNWRLVTVWLIEKSPFINIVSHRSVIAFFFMQNVFDIFLNIVNLRSHVVALKTAITHQFYFHLQH